MTTEAHKVTTVDELCHHLVGVVGGVHLTPKGVCVEIWKLRVNAWQLALTRQRT